MRRQQLPQQKQEHLTARPCVLSVDQREREVRKTLLYEAPHTSHASLTDTHASLVTHLNRNMHIVNHPALRPGT
jgi:hypothetical protein